MRALLWLIGLGLLAVAGTWLAGWPGAVISGGMAGYAAPRRTRPVLLGVAATMLGWATLLLYDASADGWSSVVDILTAVTGAGLPVLVPATLALGGTLAAGGALLGLACRRPLSGFGS